MLSTTCDPIINKPKLKVEQPKDETKQDGDNKQDGKDDENTGQQPATEQEDTIHNTSAGESQSTSNNAGTEYTMHSGPTDIDTDVEWHFMNDSNHQDSWTSMLQQQSKTISVGLANCFLS